MTRSRGDSEIRVWKTEYINNKHYRAEEHKDLVVVQCEPALNGNYMVEVYEPKKEAVSDNVIRAMDITVTPLIAHFDQGDLV